MVDIFGSSWSMHSLISMLLLFTYIHILDFAHSKYKHKKYILFDIKYYFEFIRVYFTCTSQYVQRLVMGHTKTMSSVYAIATTT